MGCAGSRSRSTGRRTRMTSSRLWTRCVVLSNRGRKEGADSDAVAVLWHAPQARRTACVGTSQRFSPPAPTGRLIWTRELPVRKFFVISSSVSANTGPTTALQCRPSSPRARPDRTLSIAHRLLPTSADTLVVSTVYPTLHPLHALPVRLVCLPFADSPASHNPDRPPPNNVLVPTR